MNKENKKIFVELYIKNQKEKHPNLPEPAIGNPKTTENGANDLTRLVIEFLKFNHHQSERISSTGRPIDTTKTITDVLGRNRTVGNIKWIPGSTTPGTADISAIIKTKWSNWGIPVKIEIKWQKDRQSVAQKRYENDIFESGGVYIIVRTFDDFLEWYYKFIHNEPKI